MAGTERKDKTRDLLEPVTRRLWRNRWMLAAGFVAVLFAGLVQPGWAAIATALVFLIAVASIAARPFDAKPSRQIAAADGGALEGLSAQSLAAAVDDPLIIFDGGGTAVHVNQAAREAFGSIAPGLSLLMKFRTPEMQSALERVRAGAIASEVVDYVERVPMERVYRVTVSAIGRGTGLNVAVFKDQSETRRIDRMRADFIANASHELRTPLASISGFVETLRGPAKNDAVARDQFLQIMQNQTARMARLIDDLLSLSRLEMKPYMPPGATVDVRQILESVIDSLSPLAGEYGIVIERDFTADPMLVHGDRDELFQVFENLLENACKYGQSGERVIVSMKKSDDEVAVTIRDFGPGIPQEHIPRVTERFYRIDIDSRRPLKGTGLGLAIVKHILTRHKGRLTIQSSLGEGASFTVHLPAG